VRVTEVDVQSGVDAELGVLGHLGALVPGQRATELSGQRGDHSGDLVADCFGSVPGERRPVLQARPVAVAFHPRQVQQEREAGRALDERADRGAQALEPNDQISLPVARDGTVADLGGPFADQHLGGHELLASPT